MSSAVSVAVHGTRCTTHGPRGEDGGAHGLGMADGGRRAGAVMDDGPGRRRGVRVRRRRRRRDPKRSSSLECARGASGLAQALLTLRPSRPAAMWARAPMFKINSCLRARVSDAVQPQRPMTYYDIHCTKPRLCPLISPCTGRRARVLHLGSCIAGVLCFGDTWGSATAVSSKVCRFRVVGQAEVVLVC